MEDKLDLRVIDGNFKTSSSFSPPLPVGYISFLQLFSLQQNRDNMKVTVLTVLKCAGWQHQMPSAILQSVCVQNMPTFPR